MIDEKRLEQISKYGFVNEGVGEETFEILRLVRLGVWAEKHAVPALGYYTLIHQSLEDSRIVSGAPAREALAAIPKDSK